MSQLQSVERTRVSSQSPNTTSRTRLACSASHTSPDRYLRRVYPVMRRCAEFTVDLPYSHRPLVHKVARILAKTRPPWARPSERLKRADARSYSHQIQLRCVEIFSVIATLWPGTAASKTRVYSWVGEWRIFGCSSSTSARPSSQQGDHDLGADGCRAMCNAKPPPLKLSKSSKTGSLYRHIQSRDGLVANQELRSCPRVGNALAFPPERRAG